MFVKLPYNIFIINFASSIAYSKKKYVKLLLAPNVSDTKHSSNIRITPSRMKWAGQVVRMVEKGNAFMVLVAKLDERRPLGR